MKPIIGVIPLVDEKKESLWMLPGYFRGIEAAGGIPIMLPLTSDKGEIRQLLDTVHGILLTGGHDVNPAFYGEEPIPECGDPCRETCIRICRRSTGPKQSIIRKRRMMFLFIAS